MPHASSFITSLVLLGAAATLVFSLPLRSQALEIANDASPIGIPEHGYACAHRRSLAPPLGALVDEVEICTLNGQVFSVRLQPRPGMGSAVDQLQHPGFGARFGWTSDMRMERTSNGDRVLHHGSLTFATTRAVTAPEVPSPVVAAPRGHTVNGVLPGSDWDQLGLRNGDVIQRIDGRTLKSMGGMFDAMPPIRRPRSISLMREAIPMELTIAPQTTRPQRRMSSRPHPGHAPHR